MLESSVGLQPPRPSPPQIRTGLGRLSEINHYPPSSRKHMNRRLKPFSFSLSLYSLIHSFIFELFQRANLTHNTKGAMTDAMEQITGYSIGSKQICKLGLGSYIAPFQDHSCYLLHIMSCVCITGFTMFSPTFVYFLIRHKDNNIR